MLRAAGGMRFVVGVVGWACVGGIAMLRLLLSVSGTCGLRQQKLMKSKRTSVF